MTPADEPDDEFRQGWSRSHSKDDADAAVHQINDLVRLASAEEVKLEHFVFERFGQF